MMAMKLDALRFAFASLGLTGRLGLILAAAALAADALVVMPLEEDVDVLSERNARAALIRPKARAEVARTVAPALAEGAEATLRRMFEAAKKAGLSLDQGDYQLGQGQTPGQARYQLSLPVQGSYADIRDFIARMLNEEPALALASINLSRENIEEREIEADLQFVLYLKVAP